MRVTCAAHLILLAPFARTDIAVLQHAQIQPTSSHSFGKVHLIVTSFRHWRLPSGRSLQIPRLKFHFHFVTLKSHPYLVCHPEVRHKNAVYRPDDDLQCQVETCAECCIKQ